MRYFDGGPGAQLRITLGENIVTNAVPYGSSYIDVVVATGVLSNIAQTNGNFPVGVPGTISIVPNASAGTTRQAKEFWVANRDSVVHTLTFLVNGTSIQTVGPFTMNPGDLLTWDEAVGFQMFDSLMRLKSLSASPTSGGDLAQTLMFPNVNEVIGVNQCVVVSGRYNLGNNVRLTISDGGRLAIF